MSVATLSDHPFRVSDDPTACKRLSTPFVVALTLSVAAHAGVGAYLAYKKFVMPAPAYSADPVDGTVIELPKPPPPPEPPKPTENLPQTQPPPIDIRAPIDLPTDIPYTPIFTAPVETEIRGSATVVVPDVPITPEPPKPRPPSVIGKPDWLRKPTPAQMMGAYPDRAMRQNISGSARLSCKVTTTGTVRDCVVLSETPSEYGFGGAALRVSRNFRMKPQTIDGQVIEGASVQIPLTFQLE